MATDSPSNDEREQTDESLRTERDLADRFSAALATVDDTADAVIDRARTRADQVLAAARAKADAARTQSAPPAAVARARQVEDQVLREERSAADDVLLVERRLHAALLSTERSETDKDLSSERSRSDVALATRDEFLGIVSHDLRNMLNAVMGFARLITHDIAGTDHTEIPTHAARITRSGARMSRLVGDLVDIASIESGKLAVSAVVADGALVVTEAVETFHAQAAASGVSLELEVPAVPIMASFDAARLLQVLANLIGNAIKFTPPKGRVVVRLESKDGGALFSVSDTGIGIPSDKLDAVFDRYLQVDQRDRRGVGLGLYISKCIVQGHGGRIWTESTVGRGSTFFVSLPHAE